MREGVNKEYDIVVEILSPVHVGVGDENNWEEGVDFLVKGEYLHKINVEKLFKVSKLDKIDLSNKISNLFSKGDSEGLLKIIGDDLDEITTYKYKIPGGLGKEVVATFKDVVTGRPLIPGSSIKGAIRSAILKNLLNGDNQLFYESKDGKLNVGNLFGKSSEGSDFMRFLKCSDIIFNKSDIANSKLFNVHSENGNASEDEGGWKNSRNTSSKYDVNTFNTVYEVIEVKDVGNGRINLGDLQFDLFSKINKPTVSHKRKSKILSNEIDYLFEIINKNTKSYLDKEIKFFEKFEAERSSEILESLLILRSEIENSDNTYCLLKMGLGTGFHSITGDWQCDDYINTKLDRNGVRKYKSRKTIDYKNNLSLMGFIKIYKSDCVSEEIKSKFAEIENEKKKIEEERIENLKAEAERLRKIAEEKELNDKCKRLAVECEELFKLEQYSEIEEKIKEGENLIPNNKYFESIKSKLREEQLYITSIKQVKELIELKKFDEAKSRLFDAIKVHDSQETSCLKNEIETKEKQSKSDVDLSAVIKTPNLKTIGKNIQKWLKNKGRDESLETDEVELLYSKLEEFKLNLKNKDKKDWKKKTNWKEIEILVGEEKVGVWMEHLND